MYASSHFIEIESVAWDNSTSNKQKRAPTVQYFTKLYSDCIAFQNRDAGEKPYESSAQIETTTLPASRISVSPPDYSLYGTKR